MYESWKSNITKFFYKPVMTQQQLETEMQKLKETCCDPTDLLNKRLHELRAIFIQIP